MKIIILILIIILTTIPLSTCPQAINSAGTSVHGEVLSALTAVSSPAVVVGVKARPLTPSSLRLTLRPPNDHGAAITSYVCEVFSAATARQVSLTPDTPTTDQEVQAHPITPAVNTVSVTLEDLQSETIYKLVLSCNYGNT